LSVENYDTNYEPPVNHDNLGLNKSNLSVENYDTNYEPPVCHDVLGFNCEIGKSLIYAFGCLKFFSPNR
jgi:hypothetical protein